MIYHLFSFCGFVVDYKIHVDMEVVSNVQWRTQGFCLGGGGEGSTNSVEDRTEGMGIWGQ